MGTFLNLFGHFFFSVIALRKVDKSFQFHGCVNHFQSLCLFVISLLKFKPWVVGKRQSQRCCCCCACSSLTARTSTIRTSPQPLNACALVQCRSCIDLDNYNTFGCDAFAAVTDTKWVLDAFDRQDDSYCVPENWKATDYSKSSDPLPFEGPLSPWNRHTQHIPF